MADIEATTAGTAGVGIPYQSFLHGHTVASPGATPVFTLFDNLTRLGSGTEFNKPSGTVLTLAETQVTLIYSEGPGLTTYRIPTAAQLNFFYPTLDQRFIRWSFQRRGAGEMIIQGALNRGNAANATAMTGFTTALPGDWCYRTDLSQSFFLASGSPLSASNWVAISNAAANKPSTDAVAFPKIKLYDPMKMFPQNIPAFHPPVTVQSAGLDTYFYC